MSTSKFQLKSSFTKAEVAARIQSIVREESVSLKAEEKASGGRAGNTHFVGEASEDEFSIRRDIRYRNAFLPRIKGTIVENSEGTKVKVAMSIQLFVMMFMILWFGIVIVAFLVIMSSKEVHGSMLLAPIGLVFFAAAIASIGYYPEALKARRLLEEALEPKAASDLARSMK